MRRPAPYLAAIAILIALCSTLATPAPAHADGWYCFSRCSFKDRRGDAPKRADIRGVATAIHSSSFTLRMRIRSLPRSGRFVFGAGLGGWGTNYWVSHKPGRTRVQVNDVTEVAVGEKSPCPGARVRWNRSTDVVTAVFPFCSGDSPDGGAVVNGVDFFSSGAHDRAGQVYYRP